MKQSGISPFSLSRPKGECSELLINQVRGLVVHTPKVWEDLCAFLDGTGGIPEKSLRVLRGMGIVSLEDQDELQGQPCISEQMQVVIQKVRNER